MAIDPHAPPDRPLAAFSTAGSVIENEISSYRAVSRLAVLSLACGLLSILSFANFGFLIPAVLAVVVGVIALRRIARQPLTLTGTAIAQAGIVLGLMCGLSSVTIDQVSNALLKRRATAFVQGEIIPVINDAKLDDALWFKTPPDERRGMTPEQVRQKLQASNSDPFVFEMVAGQIAKLTGRVIKEKGTAVRFLRIESSGYDGTTPVVLAVLAVDHPEGDSHKHAEGDDLAAVVIRSKEGSNQAWWVSDYLYPYKPNSYVEKIEAPDHGHDH